MIDEELYSLCQHLNISENEINKPFSVWRFAVLHVRGVENLNSEDVYNYFSKTPHSIEWLSNISCNITFENWQKAANALLNIANGLIVHKTDLPSNMENLGLEVQTSDKLEIPVPPNYRYILGTDHPKAKSIIVRFATVNDRKVGVDGKISVTELKPNYILKDDEEDMETGESSTSTIPKRTIFTGHSNQNRNNPNDVARVRMRMHADDEQERGKQSYPDRDDDYEDTNRRRNNLLRQENRAGNRRLNGRIGQGGDRSGFDRSRIGSNPKNDRVFTNSSRIRRTANGIETVGNRNGQFGGRINGGRDGGGRQSPSIVNSPRNPSSVSKSKNSTIWRRSNADYTYYSSPADSNQNNNGNSNKITDLRQKLRSNQSQQQQSRFSFTKSKSPTNLKEQRSSSKMASTAGATPTVSSTIRVQVSYDEEDVMM